MSFDEVYEKVGQFGKYQLYVVILTSINALPIVFIFQGTVFLLALPDHRCAIPGYNNDTFAVHSPYHQELINRSIPKNDACHVFPADVQYDSDNRPINATPYKCDSWVYDKSVFDETLSSKLDLACDRTIYKSNAQMIFFGGVLTGSFATGVFSDRFGRRFTTNIFTILMIGASFAIAWTPNYLYYVIVMFFMGFVSTGTFMPLFITGLEFVGPKNRKDATLAGPYFGILGGLLLALSGYSLRNFFHFQLVTGAVNTLMLVYLIILPESPRWLYSRGRFDESEEIVKKIAKYNKTVLPEKFIHHLATEEEHGEPPGKIWQMFSTRRLTQRTLIIFYNWFVVCIAYYGLAFNSGNLGDSVFLSYTLNVIADLPGVILMHLIIDRTGRKPFLIACMLIGGLGCLATVFTLQFGGDGLLKLTTGLAMLGKMGLSSGFITVYLYSAELYPTTVRNAGMGTSSCMARVGGMVAPYVANLGNLVESSFGKALPMLVFGILALFAALLDLLLPETLNKHLPETIEEADRFGRGANLRRKRSTLVNVELDEDF